MSGDAAAAPALEAPIPEPPVFDPDPDLVADLEGNPLALRGFRKAARKAHDEAVKASRQTDDDHASNP